MCLFLVENIPGIIDHSGVLVFGHSVCSATIGRSSFCGEFIDGVLIQHYWVMHSCQKIDDRCKCVYSQASIKHQGWNKTLLARDFKPLCPQLDDFVFDETRSGYPYKNHYNEDCLFLNIWLPEVMQRAMIRPFAFCHWLRHLIRCFFFFCL